MYVFFKAGFRKKWLTSWPIFLSQFWKFLQGKNRWWFYEMGLSVLHKSAWKNLSVQVHYIFWP